MSALSENIIRVFEIVTIGYGTVWFSKYLERRKEYTENNLEKDFVRKQEILPILGDICSNLGAIRVYESVFSNGDTTFSGHHLKKLSIAIEWNKEGYDDIGYHFQLIPTKKFERMLDALYESHEDFVIFDESKYDDDLAHLKRMFGLNYTLNVKVRDQINRWIGNITVVFEGPVEITDSQIAFVKTQASRIGSIK